MILEENQAPAIGPKPRRLPFPFLSKVLLALFSLSLLGPLAAAEKSTRGNAATNASQPAAQSLPFERTVINRYSLDHLPRSLSIRQGKDVWLGFDLERAKLYKAWQAPAGTPGLTSAGFVTKSVGNAWFEDKSAETWQLHRAGKQVPLTVRYLGCSQREGHFLLSWELRHDTGAIKLQERVPLTAATERVTLELRAEALAADESLLPPLPAREPWKLKDQQQRPVTALSSTEWHRLVLP